MSVRFLWHLAEEVSEITHEEAVALTATLFNGEIGQKWAEACSKMEEGERLLNEANEVLAQIADKQGAYLQDYRALSYIAQDRENGVYCFVFPRKEVWFYDGKNCPAPETVEVVWKEGAAPGRRRRWQSGLTCG